MHTISVGTTGSSLASLAHSFCGPAFRIASTYSYPCRQVLEEEIEGLVIRRDRLHKERGELMEGGGESDDEQMGGGVLSKVRQRL
jgi:hypothetical protein